MIGIVGREAELAAVGRFLDSLANWPAAIVIEGEAGIGKTTVWAETVRGAAARGYNVVQARPSESETSLSYAALADLVGEVFEQTRAELPPVQQRALAAALLRAESADAVNARTTGTALVGILSALAVDAPLLVAIDDVQWLDPASADALAFAARRLPPRLGLVVARRSASGDDPPLGLTRALPEDRLVRVVLGPLSLAALHHLISGRLGTSPPRPSLLRLAKASGGNPFFALEIARALARDAGERATDEPLPIPRSLEAVVADRVRALSQTARQAALIAAALSRPTASTVAAALAEDGDARAALLEAEEAGVLVAERDRIRFAHPLLASGIYGSASQERRRQLHERLATLVTDAEERARHRALGATGPDDVVAADLERAAVHAAKRGAQQAAAELFAASRRLTPGERTEDLARRELGEASALLAAGDVDGARRLAEGAVNAAAPALRAEVFFLLGEIAWISGSNAAREYFEAALKAAPEDQELAARVYPKLVNYTTPHDPARAVEHAEAAMQRLSEERHPGALAHIVFDRLWADAMLGRGENRELVNRWRALESKAGPDAPMNPAALIRYWSLDEFEAARARYALEEKWYRDRGEELWRAERKAHLGYAELRAGRWNLAEEYLEEACDALAQQLGRPGPWATAFRLRAFLDAHRGRTERARATLMPFIAEAERTGRAFWEAIGLSTLGFVEFAEGNHLAADQALTRMHERLVAIGTRDLPPDRSEPFHIEALHALGELDRARDALERLEERGRVLPRLWIDVTLPRARSLALAADGDVTAALAALDELDPDAAAKLPFDLGWTLLVRGRLRRRAKQKRAAADALAEALAIFERLGAPAWVEQTRAELARIGLRRAPHGLTATELRVAELAATGLTNREVASAAFMSAKTVQANLTRVYRKLGIRSRAELGARMAQEASAEQET